MLAFCGPCPAARRKDTQLGGPHGWRSDRAVRPSPPLSTLPWKSASLGHSEALSVPSGRFSQLASATSRRQQLMMPPQHRYRSPGYEPMSPISISEKSSQAQRNQSCCHTWVCPPPLWDFTRMASWGLKASFLHTCPRFSFHRSQFGVGGGV